MPETAGVVPLRPEELQNDVVLGVLQVRASLSDELKARPLMGMAGTAVPFRDRFDSVSNMPSMPSYQEQGHISQGGVAVPPQMAWGQFQPSPGMPQGPPAQTQLGVLPEGSQMYPPFRPPQ